MCLQQKYHYIKCPDNETMLITYFGSRNGKAVTITYKGGKGHKEKVSDLVDNKLLDEHDKVLTRVPAIARHEVEGKDSTFFVLASAHLASALKPQQVVDVVNAALKVCLQKVLSSVKPIRLVLSFWGVDHCFLEQWFSSSEAFGGHGTSCRFQL